MKKFFTLIAMAMATIAANADVKTIYSWESPDGTVVETGGTIAYVNGDGDRLNYKNADYYTICLNGKKANLADEAASANAGHMVITLDETVKSGDQIVMTAYYNKGEDKNVSAWIVFENGEALGSARVNHSADIARDGKPEEITVEIPAAAEGSKTVTLTRNDGGTNMFITKFVIKGERGVADAINETTVNVKSTAAKKVLRNGQLIIETAKGNYNIAGAQMK